MTYYVTIVTLGSVTYYVTIVTLGSVTYYFAIVTLGSVTYYGTDIVRGVTRSAVTHTDRAFQYLRKCRRNNSDCRVMRSSSSCITWKASSKRLKP